MADKPLFKEIAQEARDFIGDSPVYITCHTKIGAMMLTIKMYKKLEPDYKRFCRAKKTAAKDLKLKK